MCEENEKIAWKHKKIKSFFSLNRCESKNGHIVHSKVSLMPGKNRHAHQANQTYRRSWQLEKNL